MSKDIHKHVTYFRIFMMHFMIFLGGIVFFIWIGNYIFSNFPWVDIIVYSWGIVLVFHAILIFSLMGLLGDKLKEIGIRVNDIIISFYKKI